MPKATSMLRSKIEEAIAPRKDKDEEDDFTDLTRARVVDSVRDEEEDDGEYDIAEKSGLRTRNAPRLADFDPRYRGKTSSRRSLEKERGDLDEEELEKAELGHMFEVLDNSEEADEKSSSLESDLEDEGEEDLEEENASDDGMKQMSASNVAHEVKKGLAIKNQLSIWESLVECRIQLQKILTKINRFPQHGVWDQFMQSGDKQYQLGVKKAQGSIAGVLNELLDLQDGLVAHSSENELRNSFKRKRQSESTPSKKMKIDEYACVLDELHNATIPYRDATIEKWNDKTQLAAGAVSNKSFSGFETSVLRQIEHILSDRTRLVSRTQIKRSTYRILGTVDEKGNDVSSHDVEIFDDDDFYHQLLRELIDRKSADLADPTQLGKHWLQVQKLRSKTKKSVDVRASKGRKTRYDIHSKLVNFVAPSRYCAWKEEAKNELFSSLFGNASANASGKNNE